MISEQFYVLELYLSRAFNFRFKSAIKWKDSVRLKMKFDIFFNILDLIQTSEYTNDHIGNFAVVTLNNIGNSSSSKG